MLELVTVLNNVPAPFEAGTFLWRIFQRVIVSLKVML